MPWVADEGKVRDTAYLDREMACFLLFSYVEFHRGNRISQATCINKKRERERERAGQLSPVRQYNVGAALKWEWCDLTMRQTTHWEKQKTLSTFGCFSQGKF